MDVQDCPECNGDGCYWTPWSDMAMDDFELMSRVILAPNDGDFGGAALVVCHVCQGYKGPREGPERPLEGPESDERCGCGG